MHPSQRQHTKGKAAKRNGYSSNTTTNQPPTGRTASGAGGGVGAAVSSNHTSNPHESTAQLWNEIENIDSQVKELGVELPNSSSAFDLRSAPNSGRERLNRTRDHQESRQHHHQTEEVTTHQPRPHTMERNIGHFAKPTKASQSRFDRSTRDLPGDLAPTFGPKPPSSNTDHGQGGQKNQFFLAQKTRGKEATSNSHAKQAHHTTTKPSTITPARHTLARKSSPNRHEKIEQVVSEMVQKVHSDYCAKLEAENQILLNTLNKIKYSLGEQTSSNPQPMALAQKVEDMRMDNQLKDETIKKLREELTLLQEYSGDRHRKQDGSTKSAAELEKLLQEEKDKTTAREEEIERMKGLWAEVVNDLRQENAMLREGKKSLGGSHPSHGGTTTSPTQTDLRGHLYSVSQTPDHPTGFYTNNPQTSTSFSGAATSNQPPVEKRPPRRPPPVPFQTQSSSEDRSNVHSPSAVDVRSKTMQRSNAIDMSRLKGSGNDVLQKVRNIRASIRNPTSE